MEIWPPTPAGFRAWSQATRQRLAIVLTSLLPPEELGVKPANSSNTLPDFVGSFAATLPSHRRLGIRVLIDVFWVAAPLLILGQAKMFGALDQADRELLFTRIVYSRLYPVRLIGLMLKSFAGLGIIGDPAVRRELCIDPASGPLPPLGQHVPWDSAAAEMRR